MKHDKLLNNSVSLKQINLDSGTCSAFPKWFHQGAIHLKHLHQRQKVWIMAATMAALLFTAINQIIVGIALPKIVSELGGAKYFSWVFTAYMFSACVVLVIGGRLSDTYGRKPVMLSGLFILLTGSLLAGSADDIFELIIYRAIQGIGGGFIMAISFSVIGDLFSPRERGRWQGLLGASFGLASLIGPPVGGLIIDYWHWNWVFWVFMPLGFFAVVMIIAFYPSTLKRRHQYGDYAGTFLLAATITALLATASWVSQPLHWDSIQTLMFCAFTVIALMLFVFVERQTQYPILPLSLFNNSAFVNSNLIVFLIGASMFGTLLFVPIFLQGVLGLSATTSGSMMLLMTLGLVTASIVGGQIVSRTGKYKKLAIFGLAMTVIGICCLSTLNESSGFLTVEIYLSVVGIGFGIGLPIFILTAQNALDHTELGVGTATVQLFRQLGATIGVAILGNLMSYSLERNYNGNMLHPAHTNVHSALLFMGSKRIDYMQVLFDPDRIVDPNRLPIQNFDLLQNATVAGRESLTVVLSYVFACAALPAFAALILAIFFEEIPLHE